MSRKPDEPRCPTGISHVILDRDGTLNRELESGWLRRPCEWEWERGALEALRLWSQRGILISVVTNQSGVGRGVVSRTMIDNLHNWLRAELAAAGVPLAGIYVCPHAPEAGCHCRKPEPGLVLEAIRASGIPADRTILIGDDIRDLSAGRAAGLGVALVRTGKGKKAAEQVDKGTPVFDDLLAAADIGERGPAGIDRR